MEETEFRFDIKETRRKGHDFKDFICPDSMEFTGDYFKIGERYGRVLFLREYASLYQGQYGCRNDRSQPQSDDVH